MRLGDFIAANTEAILGEWEAFARSLLPGEKMDRLALRDHAEQILRATARDMSSLQTATEQSDKSKGEGEPGEDSFRVDGASEVHAVARVHSGFNLLAVVSEYRALRASVIRLWRESLPTTDRRDLDDLTRFNESIDQSLTEAIRSYSERVDWSRQMFLAILGHDLRNPLDSVRLSAEVLLRNRERDAETIEMARIICSGATAMAAMLNDLLDFSASGLGASMPLSRSPMELQGLCREVVDEIRAAHPTRIVRFQTNGQINGEWDGARLRQVLSNLLGNAIQHGAGTGAIELTISGEPSEVHLAVHNQGPAIPQEVLSSIFNPMVRGTPDRHKRRRVGSIGLGLHIAREIVTAHGGDIQIKSSEEFGTMFTVRLPRHARQSCK